MIWHFELAAVIAARILFGLAHGCLYVVVICHASENAVSEMRGNVVSSVGLVSATAAFITVASSYDTNIATNHLIGIVSISITILGMFLSRCFSYESIVFLLQRGHHVMALQNMMKLRNEMSVNWSIQSEFDELQRYVQQEAAKSLNIFQRTNFRALSVVSTLRYLSFITNNILLNRITVSFLFALIGASVQTMMASALFLTGVRMLFAVIATMFGNSINRKWMVALSGGAGGLFLLIAAIIFSTITFYFGMGGMAAFFVICHAFFGFGLDTVPVLAASEAFSLRKKAMSIAFVETCNNILHIGAVVLLLVLPNTNATYFTFLFVPAVLLIVFTPFMFWLMPDTRNMTLQQSASVYSCGKVQPGQNSFAKNNVIA